VFLDPQGCPVCQYCVEAEDQFFRWFDIEAFADPAMQLRLRRSAGFCAPHARRALAIRQLAPAHAIVRGALDRLGSDPPAPGECPACASVSQAREHAEQMLGSVTASRAMSARYAQRERGACLPHLTATIAVGDADVARSLAEKLRRDLATSDDLELLAGRDREADSRVALRAALPSGLAVDAASSAEAERATWHVDACPVCLAAGRSERRYLDWRRHEERADAIDLDQDPGLLCAAHVHELAALDERAGGRAARRVRERWVHELDGLLKRWPPPPPRTRRLLRGRRRAPAPRLRAPLCPACRARDGAEERHLDLLLRLLAQRPYADAYDAAHGVCLRHALLAGEGPAAGRIRGALRARLAALEWEIAEAGRKQGWDARHERPGPEQTARLRLAALLDGATFLGGPARELP